LREKETRERDKIEGGKHQGFHWNSRIQLMYGNDPECFSIPLWKRLLNY